jgi:hypothetical protein
MRTTMMRITLALAVLALVGPPMATASPPATLAVATVSPPASSDANAVNNVVVTTAPVNMDAVNSNLVASLGYNTATAITPRGTTAASVNVTSNNAQGALPGTAQNSVALVEPTKVACPGIVAGAGTTVANANVAVKYAPEVAYYLIKPF